MDRSEIMVEFDSHGILPTSQRLEIAEILFEKQQHLSADQIIDRLRAQGSAVSKATVYNTLNLFIENGLVQECIVDPERRVYDSNTQAHHHYYNLDTGELTDIPRDRIKIKELPDLPGDRQIEDVQVMIRVRSTIA